jgi:4-hydroxybenzoyl-CoA thioesterase
MPADQPPSGKIILDEEVVAAAPLVVRRYVKWGEIDFARVAYTGKFLDYMVEATETWFKHVTGEHWAQFDLRTDLSLPVVGCALDFHVALHPDDRLDLTVRLDHIGRSSHKLSVNGHNQHGVLCFEGNITYAAINPDTGESVAMPDGLRAHLEAYRKACEAAEA